MLSRIVVLVSDDLTSTIATRLRESATMRTSPRNDTEPHMYRLGFQLRKTWTRSAYPLAEPPKNERK